MNEDKKRCTKVELVLESKLVYRPKSRSVTKVITQIEEITLLSKTNIKNNKIQASANAFLKKCKKLLRRLDDI